MANECFQGDNQSHEYAAIEDNGGYIYLVPLNHIDSSVPPLKNTPRKIETLNLHQLRSNKKLIFILTTLIVATIYITAETLLNM